MSPPSPDPRVFYAAERTLLAWVRTGITIIALGFVIARFGLFVQLLAIQSSIADFQENSQLSAILGVLFIVVGALAIFIAAIQHKRFIATLSNTDLPMGYSKRFAISLSILIASLGIVLAFYLMLT